jgi:hypothetical protein
LWKCISWVFSVLTKLKWYQAKESKSSRPAWSETWKFTLLWYSSISGAFSLQYAFKVFLFFSYWFCLPQIMFLLGINPDHVCLAACSVSHLNDLLWLTLANFPVVGRPTLCIVFSILLMMYLLCMVVFLCASVWLVCVLRIVIFSYFFFIF